MTQTNYVSNTGVRVLKVLKLLAGHTLTGVSNSELARTLGEPPSAVTRALATLIDQNFAIKLDNGRFAPSVALLAMAEKHANELASGAERLMEIKQRIAAAARQ